MQIAVLVKQVPKFEEMTLGPDGRLQREGLELELNPYCRRAVSKGVELARESGGRCIVVTLGPPAAEDSLREAVAWGADEGVLVSDPAFAGSDTLATARALAAALEVLGPFDLVLCGRNSVDADTGQVAPQVAQMLDLPFLGAVKELELEGRAVVARCELDDGWVRLRTQLPAVVSCAERLCEPAKVPPEGRAAVPAEKIRRLAAADLGPGPWGAAGSPTWVGEVRTLEVSRDRKVLSGSVEEQVAQAVALLADTGAFEAAAEGEPEGREGAVPDGWERSGSVVAVVVEGDRGRVARELLGAGARVAHGISGRVVALVPDAGVGASELRSWGADEVIAYDGTLMEEDLAACLATWCEEVQPFAVVLPSTMWGREVGSRVAARTGSGLTGDAIDLTVDDGRLVAWKPAFGGQLVAAITASSPIQMATVRPGLLPLLSKRLATPAPAVGRLDAASARRRVEREDLGHDDDIEVLANASVVIGVGNAVEPEHYDELEPLRELLGAELGATRKVTDKGWLPRARQIGITGRNVAPVLYFAIALSGKFNHMVGVRSAGKILAINADPDALVFEVSDIGIVGSWREVLPVLTDAIREHLAESSAVAS